MSNPEGPEQEPAPVDLTPLAGMRLDATRADALLGRIQAAAAPGLERRAVAARASGRRITATREVERVIARFTWAALAAAAAAVFVVARFPGTSDSVTASVAQAVTQTDSTTHWIAQQAVPTDAELVMALGLETVQ